MKVIRTSVRESLFQSQVIKFLGRDMEERYEAISTAESVIEESMTHLGQKKELESCLTNKEGAWRDNERQEQPDHQSPEDSQISVEAWTDFERTRRHELCKSLEWIDTWRHNRWTPYWRSDLEVTAHPKHSAIHRATADLSKLSIDFEQVKMLSAIRKFDDRCTKGAKWKGAGSSSVDGQSPRIEEQKQLLN